MNKITLYEFSQTQFKKTITFVFFIALLFNVENTFSQINYTFAGFNGSSTESYNIDLDGDGTDDFNISSGNFLGGYLNITPLSTNAVISITNNNPTVLFDGDLIDSTSTWDTDDSQGLYYNFLSFFVTGNWENVSNKYLGLQFSIGGNTHFAWMQLIVVDNTTWTIIDYAYEINPDIGISAGSLTVLNVEDEFSSEVKAFTYNQELKILNLPERANYKLYSSLGQLVETGIAQRNNYTINTSKFASGMYILKVEGNNSGKTLTKKMILQ